MRTSLTKSMTVCCSAALVAASLLCGSVFLGATAAEDNGSLTLHCVKDDVILENLQWDLYRVGSRNGDTFVTDGNFAAYDIVIDDFSDDAMAAYAKTLENIAVLDDTIQPDREGATDAQGTLIFDQLPSGLYLVCGEILKVGEAMYIPSSLLFEINSDHATMDWDAYPKVELHTKSEQEVRYTIKKVWLNEADEPCDPTTTITVEIYCDLELYQTVVLSEENDWYYEWEDFDYYDFRVKEVVIPEGFRVEYDNNDTQYLIKNILMPVETTTTSTEATETTTTVSSTTLITTATSDERLPQTGQLWWPVPVLGLLGVLLVAVGLRFRTMENNNDENETF